MFTYFSFNKRTYICNIPDEFVIVTDPIYDAMVRVIFLHPDLGIGGAERLVVDAALAMKERGHEVSFLTNHHDPAHCFRETVDGTFPVQVVGDWLPRKVFGRFYAFCAYIRMLYATFYASFCLSRRSKIDILFCDLISIGIPILRLAKYRPKVIYYCHFPDQLLSLPKGLLKNIYRAPLNFLEEYTIGLADKVLVNSKFTLRVFCETFRRLDIVPDVLYPTLNTKYFDGMLSKMRSQSTGAHDHHSSSLLKGLPQNAFIFLDINRYERKKNHAVGIKAFGALAAQLLSSEFKQCRLVVAGGYDTRVTENVEHYKELEDLTQQLLLEDQVVLLRSPKDDEKFQLLHAAHCLLYTPENEHFGIVPLEGMYMSKPVIAVNSGGPMETIVNNSTGFLCEQDENKFAAAMVKIFKDEMLRNRMGVMGRKRVQQKFSFEAFSDKLESIVNETLSAKSFTASNKEK